MREIMLLWSEFTDLHPRRLNDNTIICNAFVVFFSVNNIMYLMSTRLFFLRRFIDMFDFESDETESDVDEVIQDENIPSKSVITGVKHMNEIKEVLELSKFQRRKLKKIKKRKEAKARKLGSGGGIIQTLASKSKGCVVPEVVTFVDHKNRKKVKDKIESEAKDIKSQINRKEITMKQARFEVFKLGVSAMSKEAQIDANTALAIRLGAKPAKNESLPYQEFKDKRLVEKEEQKKKIEEDRNALQVMKQRKKGVKEKTKTSKSKKKGEQMKVGTFDGGMLKLSSKEISRLKSKK